MNEFRFQSLHGSWTIIAPNRSRKPDIRAQKPEFETVDPFITGNENKTPVEIYSIRDKSTITASWRTRVFANKFPLLALESPISREQNGIYSTIGGFGAHEMIIDHQKPSKHICRFSADQLRDLMQTFRDRISALYQDNRIASVVAFKNHGTQAGSAIPHTHSQIVAMPFIAPEIATQVENSRTYYKQHERCMLCDMLAYEEDTKERFLTRNRYFIAFVPFAPRSDFEVWIAPIVHQNSFTALTKEALSDLGEILEWVLARLGLALLNPDINILLCTDPPRRNHIDPNYFHQIDKFFHWHLEILPRINAQDGFALASGISVCSVWRSGVRGANGAFGDSRNRTVFQSRKRSFRRSYAAFFGKNRRWRGDRFAKLSVQHQ